MPLYYYKTDSVFEKCQQWQNQILLIFRKISVEESYFFHWIVIFTKIILVSGLKIKKKGKAWPRKQAGPASQQAARRARARFEQIGRAHV